MDNFFRSAQKKVKIDVQFELQSLLEEMTSFLIIYPIDQKRKNIYKSASEETDVSYHFSSAKKDKRYNNK